MSNETKKPAATRVYPISTQGELPGKTRYIQAKSAAEAVVFAYKPTIGEPLTGSQVVAVMREHGVDAIEVAT